jgi:hypothetical protein
MIHDRHAGVVAGGFDSKDRHTAHSAPDAASSMLSFGNFFFKEHAFDAVYPRQGK